MDHPKKPNKVLTFLILVACTVVVTYLTILSLVYIKNALGPISPILMGLSTVLLTVFICALYLLVLAGGFMELRDRLHFHKMVRQHRELDLQKHRREVLLGGYHRITEDLHVPYSRHRVTAPRIRSINSRDWTRP
ncbi:MAG: hypothetical protein JOZ18_17210 [Chloroflexi bacterium]|nr:hypothetical protein [Chloroflexota bacterium]